jgi:hypothetical protein
VKPAGLSHRGPRSLRPDDAESPPNDGPQTFVHDPLRYPQYPATGRRLMSRLAYPVTLGAAGRGASGPPQSWRRTLVPSVVASQPVGAALPQRCGGVRGESELAVTIPFGGQAGRDGHSEPDGGFGRHAHTEPAQSRRPLPITSWMPTLVRGPRQPLVRCLHSPPTERDGPTSVRGTQPHGCCTRLGRTDER